MKGQEKTPEKTTNTTEINNLPDRVQSISNKNANWIREKNRWTQWEFWQETRKYRKEPARTEEYNNWNEKL